VRNVQTSTSRADNVSSPKCSASLAANSDDLELLVDGVTVEEAPNRVLTVLDTASSLERLLAVDGELP
jgi:hypothetical protein